MAASFDPVVSLSIVTSVVKTFASTDTKLSKALAAIQGERSKALNIMLDAFWVACDKPKDVFLKGNAATNPARAQVKGVFDAIVEAGHLSKATAATYQTCFWIAFVDGVKWAPDLANAKTKAKGEGEGEGEGEAKPTTAKSKVITLVEAQRSFSVALAQLRAVNQEILAGDLLDVMLAQFPDFKESTTK